MVGVNAGSGRRLVALHLGHHLNEVAALDLLAVDCVTFGVQVIEALRYAGVAVRNDPVTRPAFFINVFVALLVGHGRVAVVDLPREIWAN
jgi:hypothetical protein